MHDIDGEGSQPVPPAARPFLPFTHLFGDPEPVRPVSPVVGDAEPVPPVHPVSIVGEGARLFLPFRHLFGDPEPVRPVSPVVGDAEPVPPVHPVSIVGEGAQPVQPVDGTKRKFLTVNDVYLASERSERDTYRGKNEKIGDVCLFVYMYGRT